MDFGEFLTHGSRAILETDFNIPFNICKWG